MAKTLKILCANGVNLDLLGEREPEIYGRTTLKGLEAQLREQVKQLSPALKWPNIEIEFFQSNNEADFLKKLSATDADGILINSAAWTHTSLAIADRLRGLSKPYIEVHISNISAREEFRKHSYSASHAAGVVYGFGLDSYLLGLIGLVRKIGAK